MDEGIVKIIIAIIGLLAAIITGVIVPYYRSKTTTETREQHRALVNMAVYAVEQLQLAGLLNIPKKQAVIEYINSKGIKITVEDLDMLIEEAVIKLNMEKSAALLL